MKKLKRSIGSFELAKTKRRPAGVLFSSAIWQRSHSDLSRGKPALKFKSFDAKKITATRMGTVLYQKDVGDKTYYVVQAVPDTKAKTLYVVTAFMENNKKIETSQTADAYNSTPSVTSENGSAIVSANTISQPESKVKSKTSKSQTSAKKSKNKTADTVYKKNTKLKVGDTVGEVTLVADSETGTPVTPRLRASFAREDMPSYIMATIESLGDKELIAALEEEMFLMTADSEAELQLHDTIEELFDHVRDGEITPEQAAQVLTDELANPTGADIDTLVERAKLDGMKYMVDSKNKNNYNVNKNGGIEYDSQDTERVAGGRVSASDRSNNVLRKQGDDSGETSVRLGDGGVGSKSEKIKRHGSSGWLGEQQWTTDGSLRGLFGNLRGIKLASIDSLSRTIPNEVYERFKIPFSKITMEQFYLYITSLTLCLVIFQ